MGIDSIQITTGKIHRDRDDINFRVQITNVPRVAQISVGEDEARKLPEAILNALNTSEITKLFK